MGGHQVLKYVLIGAAFLFLLYVGRCMCAVSTMVGNIPALMEEMDTIIAADKLMMECQARGDVLV